MIATDSANAADTSGVLESSALSTLFSSRIAELEVESWKLKSMRIE
jgi:hypothetical protein